MHPAQARTLRLSASLLASLAGTAIGQTPAPEAGSTAVTYQGRLLSGQSPASGTHDLQFSLFTTSGGGAQVGSTLCANNVSVADDGTFTVLLDFGSVFQGSNLFLQVKVRKDANGTIPCGNASGYETLAPLQELTSAPSALFAMSSSSAATATSAGNADLLDNLNSTDFALLGATNAFTGTNGFQGSVGIGKANPAERLDIASGSNSFVRVTTSNGDVAFNGGNDGVMNFSNQGVNTGRTTFTNSSGSTLFSILNSNGFVGIGTSAPAAPLDVALGSKNFQVRLDGNLVPGINVPYVGGNAGALRLRNRLEIWPNDAATAPGTLDLRSNSGGVTVSFDGGAGTGWLSKLGVGTTSPAQALHVSTTDAVASLTEGSNTVGASMRLRSTAPGGRDWHVTSSANAYPNGAGKLVFHDATTGLDAATLTHGNLTVYGADQGTLTLHGSSSFGIGMNLVNADPGGGNFTVQTSGPGIGMPTNSVGFRTTTATLFSVTTGGLATVGNSSQADSRLRVVGSENTPNGNGAAIKLTNTAPGGTNWIMRAGATGTSTPAGGWSLADDLFYRLVMTSAGRMGLGQSNTAPGSMLSVDGNATIGSSYKQFAAPANGLMVQGRLGVGTINPLAPFHVGGTDQQMLFIDGNNAGGVWADIGNGAPSGRRWSFISTGTANSEGAGKLLVRDTTGNAVRMAFDISGNVGIGTSSPSKRLEVLAGSTSFTVSPNELLGVSTPDAVTLDIPGTGTLAVWDNFHVNNLLSKGGGTFKIDHPLDPENKYLYHSFVESPDMKNIYDGVVTTDSSGYATVIMPEWFDALNRDFRYQLTIVDDGEALGDFVFVRVVKKLDGNQFAIKTSQPHVEVSWQVTGVREDAFAEANRVKVEVDKEPEMRGKLLHPEAFEKAAAQGKN